MNADEQMKHEYLDRMKQREIVPTFKQRLKKSAEEGLLLFTKYSLLVVLIYAVMQFFNTLVVGSQNGTHAATYISKLIEKGYLPKVVNGEIPPKSETEVSNVQQK